MYELQNGLHYIMNMFLLKKHQGKKLKYQNEAVLQVERVSLSSLELANVYRVSARGSSWIKKAMANIDVWFF